MGSLLRTRVGRVVAILENRALDFWYAGRLLTRVTKGLLPGAKATVSTDYFVIREVFRRVDVRPSDVLVDVGSGQGRVLHFWIRQYPRNCVIGVELNDVVAGELRTRMGSRATIMAGDVLAHFPQSGTIFYLFNPFDAITLERFLSKAELNLAKPATLIYVFPVHGQLLESRPGWQVEKHTLSSRLRGIQMPVLIAHFQGAAQ